MNKRLILVGIVTVLLTIFGYEDNGNLSYDSGTDTPYSQTIPFQAYSVTET